MSCSKLIHAFLFVVILRCKNDSLLRATLLTHCWKLRNKGIIVPWFGREFSFLCFMIFTSFQHLLLLYVHPFVNPFFYCNYGLKTYQCYTWSCSPDNLLSLKLHVTCIILKPFYYLCHICLPGSCRKDTSILDLDLQMLFHLEMSSDEIRSLNKFCNRIFLLLGFCKKSFLVDCINSLCI